MRFLGTCFSLIVAVFIAVPLSAQQSPQAVSLLQKSLTAQMGSAATTDVTLGGTISFLKGSKPAVTGTATLTALADGSTQAVLNLPSGTGTEVWLSSNGSATVSSSGPNGNTSKPAGGDMTMPGPAWFSPVLLTSLLSGSGYESNYAGKAKWNGATVEHVVAWQAPPVNSQLPAFALKEQTSADVYLNPTTFLPASIVFRVRPVSPPGKRLSIRAQLIPEEIRYSNYQSVDGRMIPLHIQVYLGKNQAIDLTITSAAFNTGATITAPN